MRVRGENVSAWEVERVFIDHPAIQACAAVGVAGDVGEQEILLYVQFIDGAPVEWAELVDWARPRLASYQLPRYFRQTPGFELTPASAYASICCRATHRGGGAHSACRLRRTRASRPASCIVTCQACADGNCPRPGRALARRFGSD